MLSNSLLIRNAANTGSAFQGNGALFVNSTVSENNGMAISVFDPTSERAGKGPAFPNAWWALRFVNTVISKNTGGNCAPVSADFPYQDGGHNLQFPPGGACGATIPALDPILDTFYVPVLGLIYGSNLLLGLWLAGKRSPS